MTRVSLTMIVLLSMGAAACGSDAEKDGEPMANATTNGAANANAGVNNSSNNSSNGMPNGSANNGGNGLPNGQTNNSDVNDVCPPEARPVYVVEAELESPRAQGRLVRWNALERTFTEIGELDCPTFEGNTPFSMSVDREGSAWVLYQSGEVFNVSTTDASCEATGFQSGQLGFEVFGMGFVLNRPGLPDETLYIAGGRTSDIATGNARLGYIRIPELSVTELSRINGWPEMSGTAAAELWAFFPEGNPPRVAAIDPSTGDETSTYPVEGIDGQPNAWAFAHWGGNFYLFYKSQTDPSSRVFELNGETGDVEEVIDDSGRYIVGAGVSTCAPLIIN